MTWAKQALRAFAVVSTPIVVLLVGDEWRAALALPLAVIVSLYLAVDIVYEFRESRATGERPGVLLTDTFELAAAGAEGETKEAVAGVSRANGAGHDDE